MNMNSSQPVRPGRSGPPPRRKAALGWLLAFLLVAAVIFIAATPAGYRLRVVVAFALVTPLAVWSLFYALRND